MTSPKEISYASEWSSENHLFATVGTSIPVHHLVCLPHCHKGGPRQDLLADGVVHSEKLDSMIFVQV